MNTKTFYALGAALILAAGPAMAETGINAGGVGASVGSGTNSGASVGIPAGNTSVGVGAETNLDATMNDGQPSAGTASGAASVESNSSSSTTTGASNSNTRMRGTTTLSERLDFGTLDGNRDGTITQMEFRDMAQVENNMQVFALIDTDGNNTLNRAEIESYVQTQNRIGR